MKPVQHRYDYAGLLMSRPTDWAPSSLGAVSPSQVPDTLWSRRGRRKFRSIAIEDPGFSTRCPGAEPLRPSWASRSESTPRGWSTASVAFRSRCPAPLHGDRSRGRGYVELPDGTAKRGCVRGYSGPLYLGCTGKTPQRGSPVKEAARAYCGDMTT